MTDLVKDLTLAPLGIIFIMQVIYIVMGMFMDTAGMILVLFYPQIALWRPNNM